ncbi:hypothetical protein KA005_72580, partial [bacterium]|nr:hypothetical protein [bacterium]
GELNKRVFKDNLEDDVYTKILRNLHLMQNILLGVYSKFEDDKFIPVALRSFKKLKNNIPQLVYLEEDNLKDKEDITLENGQPAIEITTYCQNLKNIIDINDPKVSYADNGTAFLIKANSTSYSDDIGSEIGLEILVPVVADEKLKGTFDLYFPPMKDPGLTEDYVRAIVEHLRTFLSLGGIHDEMITKVTKHSIRAAVSAIISRNHSHHIRSHVTPRATVGKIVERLQYLGYKSQGVEKIASMRKAVEKARQEIDQRTIEIEYAMEDLKDLVEEVSSSFKEDDKVVILLKTRLDKYIQQKADFTAEIGTEPLVTTKSASFFREIFIPFLENTLMLDGIGANEGVRYETLLKNRLKLHLLFDGAEIEAQWNCSKDKSHIYPYHSYPYSGHCTQCDVPTELKKIGGDYKKDIKIAVPGPLGEFAIYSILENFIRNAIKHNRTKLGLENGGRDGLDVFMDIVELDKDDPDRNDFYKVQIWDNLTNPCECRKIATDEEERTVTLTEMLKALIKRSFVDNQGKLKKGAWGIAEMKIMASLLRGSDDFSNMAGNLRVDCQKKGHDRLVYEFYVMKPKEIAVISDVEINDQKRNSLRADGVWYFSGLDEFSHHFKEGKSIASFQFVIFNKLEPEKLT